MKTYTYKKCFIFYENGSWRFSSPLWINDITTYRTAEYRFDTINQVKRHINRFR